VSFEFFRNGPSLGASRRWRIFPSGDRQAGADEDEWGVGVVRLRNCSQREVIDHSWSEDETMGGTSELEVPEFLTFGDMVSRFDARTYETRTDL
jgi:hypothetical protein